MKRFLSTQIIINTLQKDAYDGVRKNQRIVSKLGDLDSYGADPRRIDYAGANVDGASVKYAEKYLSLQQTIKDRYAKFNVEYYGKDNDDYVNGQGFCCEDAPQNAPARAPSTNDNPELFQYYYHSDHLGSTSLITNLDGEIVQHIEYVPFGEVFIEERNNKWNTPYLFNAKELDEETGLYYYGARYYEPRISVWYGADPMQEKYPEVSSYAYCLNNPIRYIDPDGNTFGDYRTSRVSYSGGGTFCINLNSLHNFTRNNILAANENRANWKSGEIGISTVVGQFTYQQSLPTEPPGGRLPRLSSTYDATQKGYDITQSSTKAETAKSTGLPDQRVRTRTVTTGNVSGAGTRGGATFMIALDAFFIGYGILTAYWVNDDLTAIKRNQGLIKQATNAVMENLNLIDPKYQNQNDLGAIINFVYQGINTTDNPDITNIGIDILKAKGIYDPDKIKPVNE
jgi:RHS repeat-associated protein